MNQRETRYKEDDKIGGRYEVYKALMGGMGEVYLCFDTQDSIPIALKTFQPRHITTALRGPFFEEVGHWVALEKHPNIVRCFRMQTLDNQPFAFLEWVASDESRGTDLRDWLQHGPLDLRLALDFTIDICRGLRYAHSKVPGIVHRDLKPDNVLVNQSRIAKITDFGLAKVIQDAGLGVETEGSIKEPRRSNVGGTYQYMAPEQWLGTELDQRTDIYAVGCILYELLIGRWPFFGAGTKNQLRRRHLESSIPRLLDYPSVEPILERCLAKTRRDRFDSVDALLETLEQFYHTQIEQTPRKEKTGEAFDSIDYTNRGCTYQAMGRDEDALADYAQAIEIDSHLIEAYANRGTLYSQLGQHRKALNDLNKAIEISPNETILYTKRGVVYCEMGQYSQALKDHHLTLRLDSKILEAYVHLGTTYTRMGHYAEAIQNYTQAVQLDPTNSVPYFKRGVVYDNMGKDREAINDYSRAAELGSMDAQLYSNRGIIYAQAGNLTKAKADFRKAIDLEPNYAFAHFNLGVLLVNQNQYQQASLSLEKAYELGHQDAFTLMEQIRPKTKKQNPGLFGRLFGKKK